ncbi:class I glutamine amidotransferase-like protein [Pseudoneurospora amorphoporcata]|uniref:D-lactate dehydratase n=1 Tax=Pseudoneurospora amorphoporcata TaxID=241081 RepID=A0AAN6SHF5_9PEZI|nr:class I glutamine amidotransferase-like protein [Pseudoneurospora amorphoporcata]
MSAPKVLVVLTSHDKLGDTGKPTGWYLSEFAHPYDVLNAASVSLTVASPSGGPSKVDPSSIDAAKDDKISTNFLNSSATKPLFESTHPLSDFVGNPSAIAPYSAIFFPGGHGPMFDLSVSPESQQLVREFWDAGKVVAAVCHGPAALVNVKLSDGSSLLQGRKVTGFTNEEEDQVGLSKVMPFLLEDKLKEAIGTEGGFEKADAPWGEKVVVDAGGRLITGQNPASAKGVGEAILRVITAKV